MSTFTPPTRTAAVVGPRDDPSARRLLRWHAGNPRAVTVFLYDDDTEVIENAMPPTAYNSDGTLSQYPDERVSAAFYGARGAYTVNATQVATLEAAGYTVSA